MKLEMTSGKNGFIRRLGPGLITGASDDDPSGILTYLQAGVVMGLSSLWTALLTLPLMYFIQEMSGRIGLVSGKGLVKLIKENFSRPTLYFVAAISSAVIVINIGADLLAIGAALNGVFQISVVFWIAASALFILLFTIFLSYRKFSRFLGWLALSLFFYIAAVFYIKVDWLKALYSTIIPQTIFSPKNFFMAAAILGTTVSPYLFFWQASEEAEEMEEEKKEKHGKKIIVTKNELKDLKEDTFTGMFFSNAVMWFIMLGAAELALNSGLKEIADFGQAASVLKPLLGNFAYFAFSLGIIGTGLLAIPVLAGNIGYMLAEIFNWPEGMDKKFHEARGFYFAITAAAALGGAFGILNFDPVKLLVAAAFLYALITPPLVYLILKIANDKKILGDKTNSPLSNFFGALVLAVSLAALAAYFISLLR